MSDAPRRRMSRWGIGPLWTVLALAYALPVLWAERRWFPDLKMIWPPPTIGMAMALLLGGGGIAIYVSALRELGRARREQRLACEGVYAWMRHPIYSAFIIFLVPAVVLWLRSILGLSIPVVMYVLFRVLIRSEEAYLAERFGESYWQWRRRTNAILPAPPVELHRDHDRGASAS